MLRFSIEEAIAFRREHHVDQLLSISLQPTVTIEEKEDYVYIRGVLELSGEYAKREEDGEDDPSVEAVRYVEHVRINDEQIGEFLHQFPIDVTVPKERIDDLEQVYVWIESFDYDLKQHELRLIAEVAIHGIQMDDDGEDDEWEPYNVDDFEPFEVVARQEAYQQQEEETEEEENIVNVPPFYMFHEENEQVEDQHEVERAEQQKEEKQSFQLEMKGRDTNEKRNENALYLTKLFEKNEEQAFARLKICIVQQGDSLDKIAERYDVSVQQLLRTNHLESGADIHEGQLLYIPTPSKV
ncbi:stage VI sporulation protein D [Anoxybacillus mongoliensis]|uniref:Stage VI sporulation protein D n=1 Tax=Anoxybacillus mongoliensis TaxID=452565 RepID=A0A7W8JD25_9BACL|nr:LysM peptidoglycan-binding domain-containing protein [Anoxybacillus mongoliensis]MBB5354712.1 stage VI sporulation protein D [Anoxybacillus mongoliensis]MCX8001823.1 LysM peptidoglycan-binding domain-containing protein [Anoxybacillus mongoliensis]